MARDAFSQHQLIEHDMGAQSLRKRRGSALIRKLGTSNYAAEIIVCGFGTIIAHGDISLCAFQGGDSDWQQATDWVKWIASADLRYAIQKASIAYGDGGRSMQRASVEVALHEILQMIGQTEDIDTLGALEKARDNLRAGCDLEGVQRDLYDSTGDPELSSGLGRVTDARVIYARAAISKLAELLGLSVRPE